MTTQPTDRDAAITAKARERSIAQLRQTLQVLCNFIWNGKLATGEHLWSLPADPERDFDIILSDAIDELEQRRTAFRSLEQETRSTLEPYMQHKHTCKKGTMRGYPAHGFYSDCTCGLAALRAQPVNQR